MAQPVISYPGAKWRFYEYIKPYIPTDIETWIEPFFGGGSMSLSVADDPTFNKVTRMIGGDLAPEIWAMWNGIRSNPEEVVAIVTEWWNGCCNLQQQMATIGTECVQYARNKELLDTLDANKRNEMEELVVFFEQVSAEGKAFWNWLQTVDCSQLTLSQRAARTFLANKISFSGMGDSGSISVDQYLDFRLSKTDRILAASPLLKKMEIMNVSFEETMKYGNENPDKSFIFLDPPYYQQEKSGLYGRNGDTHKGFPHEHFAEFTQSMKCKWFVTYDDSIKVRKMFVNSFITPFTIKGGYTMAGKTAEDALAGEELFITNYDISNNNAEDLMSML